MNRVKQWGWMLLLVLLLSGAAAQGTQAAGLNVKALTISAGKTYQLKVKGAGKQKVTWKSSKKAVAAVSNKGKVSAKKAGKATISAKVAKKTYKCKVTVQKKKTVTRVVTVKKSTGSGSSSGSATAVNKTQSAQSELSLASLGAGYPSSSEEYGVIKTMLSFKSKYPEGMYFTNETHYYPWRGGIYRGGYGCAAFAFELSDACYGSNMALMHYNWNNIRVGDILRTDYNTHSVIVLKVAAKEVTVAESNYNSSVHWGRKISLSELKTSGSNIMTRYGNPSYSAGQIRLMQCTLPALYGEEEQQAAQSEKKETGNAGAAQSEQNKTENAKAAQSEQKETENAKAAQSEKKETESAKAAQNEQNKTENAKAAQNEKKETENARADETEEKESEHQGDAGKEASREADPGEEAQTSSSEGEQVTEAAERALEAREAPAAANDPAADPDTDPADTDPTAEDPADTDPEEKDPAAEDPKQEDPSEDESVTLSVRVLWPAAMEGNQPVPEVLDVALYQKAAYDSAMSGYGFSGDMLNYWPYGTTGYLAKVTVSAATGWEGSVTLRRSDLTLGEGQTLAEAAASDLIWKEERPLGYTWAGQTVSADALTTTISNRSEQAVTSKTLRIVWEDDNDALKLRPASVTGKLSSGQQVKLSKANEWTGTVGNLPYYSDGTRNVYEWLETDVDQYELEIEIGETQTVFTYTCLLTREQREVEVNPKHYKLTVRYYIGKKQAADSFVGIYASGETYNVKSPRIAGYLPDHARVKGTIRKNTKVNVYYSPVSYRLRVRFVGTDGKELAAAYTAQVSTDGNYQVSVPEVEGYHADRQVVSGTMPGRDHEVTVYYVPIQKSVPAPAAPAAPARETEQTVDLEEYQTPLGLGMVSLTPGDCLE